METIGMIVLLSAILLVGVITIALFSDDDNKGFEAFIGAVLIITAFVSMYYTGKLYYESKIPNIQEQVQEYNIRVAEQKLLELKGGNKE